MTKIKMIEEMVCEYGKSFGVGSEECKNVYIHHVRLINQINRKWYKEYIVMKYNQYKKGEKNICDIVSNLL